MIIDQLSHADFYQSLGSRFARAMDYLRTEDLSKLPDGRNEIDGDRLFAMVVDEPTRPLDQCLWEAHREYHDVQYVVEGVEQMGYAHIGQMNVSVPYDPAKDAEFFEGAGSMLTVPAGSFVIFTPQDVHKPSVAVGRPASVRKIVMKLAV